MSLSIPDHWTEDVVRDRFNVRAHAPAFKDGSLTAAQELVLIEGWSKLEEVALYELRSRGDDPEAQNAVGSIYEAAIHFTAFVAPAP